ncbi:MAG: aquaporin family protein [Bacteroidaceae bacterium]|nr:aquaporin family protein [Bacteroidaceae bacterium]MBQ9884285.1 aquaporin family protein [Bacteroidaceae bacterium]MBR1939752.1 aquaporin family protein [Bacteroidaceae bacterium]MBR1939801.1 aquaporin family protein [Bacteroidaceae bacterium]MBR3015373.1 aquaporin family protein [Bacteroidaceae bacterium]
MREFIGESLGTFILTLFGCGSVAVAVLFGEYTSIFQIAIVWGLAVALAIYVTRHLCPAHLNPAVSVSMALGKRMPYGKLPSYLLAQFIGAFLAGGVLLLLFNPSIEAYELAHGIERGTAASVDTARMFGEFYPNPGDALVSTVSLPLAIAAEAVGTFVLVLFIFCFTEDCNVGRPDSNIAPLFIGLTVSICITLIAPLTQAGFNPARDFGPRIVAWLAGWGSAAFPDSVGGFFWVYILGPIIGGALATYFFTLVLEPAMRKK